jgi:hypothetical protein
MESAVAEAEADDWVLGTGYWVLGTGYWVLGTGYWVLGTGYWVLGTGYWALGLLERHLVVRSVCGRSLRKEVSWT